MLLPKPSLLVTRLPLLATGDVSSNRRTGGDFQQVELTDIAGLR
jgi:hypothetical protein